jgi:hypothetical protein
MLNRVQHDEVVIAHCELQTGLDISEQNKYILKIAIGNRAHRRPPVEAPARDDPFEKILGGAGCGLRGGPRYGKLEVMSRALGLLGGADCRLMCQPQQKRTLRRGPTSRDLQLYLRALPVSEFISTDF